MIRPIILPMLLPSLLGIFSSLYFDVHPKLSQAKVPGRWIRRSAYRVAICVHVRGTHRSSASPPPTLATITTPAPCASAWKRNTTTIQPARAHDACPLCVAWDMVSSPLLRPSASPSPAVNPAATMVASTQNVHPALLSFSPPSPTAAIRLHALGPHRPNRALALA